jgi:hypothetical protein
MLYTKDSMFTIIMDNIMSINKYEKEIFIELDRMIDIKFMSDLEKYSL